jgi:hypothetical protein
MEIELVIQRLASNGETIRTLVAGVPDEQTRWRPAPDKWSMLEVINHLCDEERLDFRARINHILTGAAPPWPATNPLGWLVEHNYYKRDFGESLNDFLREREQTIEWMQEHLSSNWDAFYDHPAVGAITARDLLAPWIGHDMIHIRQLAKLHFQYLAALPDEPHVAYAGEMS